MAKQINYSKFLNPKNLTASEVVICFLHNIMQEIITARYIINMSIWSNKDSMEHINNVMIIAVKYRNNPLIIVFICLVF